MKLTSLAECSNLVTINRAVIAVARPIKCELGNQSVSAFVNLGACRRDYHCCLNNQATIVVVNAFAKKSIKYIFQYKL